ncbi:hypothetical protein AADZ90_013565 [Aestuariibius sp. 2305UL40-4]|uniref:hypothetical protein n=1 Tax=Aestuariibius violaceus TaxID=3234132 RepID=UPI00345E13EF
MYKITKETAGGLLLDPATLSNSLPGFPPDITRCTADCPFNVRIDIIESVLTPLEIDGFDIAGWNTWRRNKTDVTPFVPGAGPPGRELVTFAIQVRDDGVDQLFVELVDGRSVHGPDGLTLKRWQLGTSSSGYLAVGSGAVPEGSYQWLWDGYVDDVLSTKLLKMANLQIRVVGVKGQAFRDHRAALRGRPFTGCREPADWVDVIVDRGARTVDVEWRIAFDDGGVDGRGTSPRSYAVLQAMALVGIARHWGRNASNVSSSTLSVPLSEGRITTSNGSYQVAVKPVAQQQDATPSMTLEVSMKEDFGRSVNSSCACGVGFVRGAGDLFSDTTRTWYSYGYFLAREEQINAKRPTASQKSQSAVAADAQAKADADFEQTIAHEMGHAVLATYAFESEGADNYSWVHKGSSQGLTSGYDTPSTGEKGYEAPIGSGTAADLMKYYDFYINPDRYIAAEYDVKALIWLSNVTVGR